MKKLVGACAVAVASLGMIAPAAHADTVGCVTKAEYRKISKGMTSTRVHRVFDTDGKRYSITRSAGTVGEVRTYRTCSPYSSVAVGYVDGKMKAKSAVWQ